MRRILLASLPSLVAFAGGGGTVTAKGLPFLAEVAATDAERARGLMYRQSLAKDRCMIFLFEEDKHNAFWMKNCLISLDMVFVRADGTVVEIAENVPPLSPMFQGYDVPTYGGSVPSRNVVEFAAGTVRRIGLKKGDRIGWDLKLDSGAIVKGGVVPAKKPVRKK